MPQPRRDPVLADQPAGAAHIVDDKGKAGGLERGANFVIVGMNADPDEGSAVHDPIGLLLGAKGMARTRPDVGV
ncbi:MAG: hypothetical protein R3B49_11790 [Phycisphaerales bacterium]